MDAIRSHLILPPGAAETIALWIIFTHCFDAFEIAPVLSLTSPTPECDKTTALALLSAIVPRPLQSSNVTAAVVFRAVEKWRPTLLIDEADTFLHDSDELRGVLNSGHNRRSAIIIRTVGDDHEPKQFSTWCPKAIAKIGKLPPTLTSRSIHIQLQRKTPAEVVEPLREDRISHLEPLARKAARWAADNFAVLKASDPELPATLHSRIADNWRPLIAIADQFGGEWPERARRIAQNLRGKRKRRHQGHHPTGGHQVHIRPDRRGRHPLDGHSGGTGSHGGPAVGRMEPRQADDEEPTSACARCLRGETEAGTSKWQEPERIHASPVEPGVFPLFSLYNSTTLA